MVTSPAGYKINRVTFKPSRWVGNFILNGNKVLQAKKKWILLKNKVLL